MILACEHHTPEVVVLAAIIVLGLLAIAIILMIVWMIREI